MSKQDWSKSLIDDNEIELRDLPNPSKFSVSITNLTLGGVSLWFSGQGLPTWALTSERKLVIRIGRIDKTCSLEAQTISRSDQSDGRRYELKFLDHPEVIMRKAPELYRLFNHRGAFRVRPRSREEAESSIKSLRGDLSVRCEILDVSQTGARIGIAASSEKEIANEMCVVIGLEKINSGSPMRAHLGIRNRFLRNAVAELGCEFLWSETPSHSQIERRVSDYIMERQRESLAAKPT